VPANNGSVTYTVSANFGTNASGTYTFSVTGAAGNNGQAALFNGIPVSGATVTVIQATFTPTLSPTATCTPTPQPVTTAVIYPNPSSGGPVSLMPPVYAASLPIKVQIFTTAFRMVQEYNYPAQTYGPVKMTLVDKAGVPLASGLYYAVVTVNGNRSVAKLLLLR
jgi:hypothetical protein